MSILDVTDSDTKSSDKYKVKVQQFGKTLFELLDKAKLTEIQTVLRNAKINVADGIGLFQEILIQLVPTTEVNILDALDDLANCVHKNGEGINPFVIRVQQIFDQFNRLGYTTMDDLQRAFLQRGFL